MTMTDRRPARFRWTSPRRTRRPRRLRELRKARDAADRALQDAIAEQRQAGMHKNVMHAALNPGPACCDGKRDTDGIDGSVGHHSALLQLAGPYVPTAVPRRDRGAL